MMINQRVEELREYCEYKLMIIKSLLDDIHNLTVDTKLRLTVKIDILNHLIEYKTYGNFLNKEELNRYIEDSADIVCGFYTH